MHFLNRLFKKLTFKQEINKNITSFILTYSKCSPLEIEKLNEKFFISPIQKPHLSIILVCSTVELTVFITHCHPCNNPIHTPYSISSPFQYGLFNSQPAAIQFTHPSYSIHNPSLFKVLTSAIQTSHLIALQSAWNIALHLFNVVNSF